DQDDIKAVSEVLQSDWITQGPKVEEFEKNFATYIGARYAVAVNSGTAALHTACFAAGISKGDKVITTPITFVASANCVIYQGGTPVFADIREDTLNIDPEEIKKKITSDTRALIPVDFTGLPVDLEEILQIARKNNLVVIEDASHALGATYQGKKIGSISDMTIFSFHPVKHITTGEGGMITTNNKKYYERLKLFRTHGITKEKDKLLNYEGPWYYEMQELGYNYRLTDFQCALGLSQLKKIDRIIQRRREIVQKYNSEFKDIIEIKIPEINPIDSNPVWHIYIIQLNLDRLKVDRREIFEALRAENIGVNVHYIPVHLQPYYRNKYNFHQGDFPKAENYYLRAITLPIFPKMSEKDVDDVISTVKKIIRYYKK
ncbi:MAG: UDP-4-amino-4,6-dideoxy-N-acetyl-beta-L-altrosamine transaminase, partial [Candidatus Atribacteria bacterium]|nr:UDP-4-amino-4,6-dideoxy-N-acetyl-beta-L-altrosamine transaminase [Candidatus Atribacteria bacterium]